MQKWEYKKLVISIGAPDEWTTFGFLIQEVPFDGESEPLSHNPHFLETTGGIMGTGHEPGRAGPLGTPDSFPTPWELYRNIRRAATAQFSESISSFGQDGWEMFFIFKETFVREGDERTELLKSQHLPNIEVIEYWFKRPFELDLSKFD